jgi:hypothetical protein
LWSLSFSLQLRFLIETLMLKRYYPFAPLALAALLAVAIAGCGGDQSQPTATPAAPADAGAATGEATATAESNSAADTAPTSPLAQPNSPLAPESPLSAPAGASMPPAVGADGRPLHDVDAIRQIAAANKPRPPQQGRASLSALLFSNSWGSVIPGNLIYFTPTIEDNGQVYPPSFFSGPKEEDGDIPFYSDEYGRVNVDDVTPGSYVLAVWTVYDYIIIEDPNKPGYPQIFDVKPGDQIDLGMLELGWP